MKVNSVRPNPCLLPVQGKRMADLAKQLVLNVYGGLENVQKLTSGQLKVPHFDGKGEVEEYFRAIGVPVTSLRLSSYFENFLTIFQPQKAPDGEDHELAIPMREVPVDHGMAVADLGPVFVQLTEPEKFTGKEIGLSTCNSVVEYAAVIARCTRKAERDAQMSPESYEKLDFPGSQELAHMFHFYYVGPARDTALTCLNPTAQTFEEWMADH
ncbi:LOW QUALITY PROTEIN: nmrA-like family domain-containing protein 1 [Liasis olivaceus]